VGGDEGEGEQSFITLTLPLSHQGRGDKWENQRMVKIQKGKVLAVNTSKDKGTRKTNVQSCQALRAFGLEGDAHGGPWHRQVSLLANESIEKMRAMGLNVGYGDFAENITTEGVDLVHLPIGTTIRIGEFVIIRVTQIGKECHTRCAIYYQAGDCVMPKEGIFAEVVNEGEVKVGDEIIIA
jgi:MOSC domain-containing protein YiiM